MFSQNCLQHTHSSSVRVGVSLNRSLRAGPTEDHHNIFVARLPHSMTNTNLMELFAEFNPVRATVMMDVHTGRSKGFGFVLFPSDAVGRAVVEKYHDREVAALGMTFSMHVGASKFDGFAAAHESNVIYARNVPLSLSMDDVRRIFSAFGSLIGFDMRSDRRDASWLVTVEYNSIAEAKAAIDATHNNVMFPQLSTVPVMAKFAETAAVKTHRYLKNRASVPFRRGYHCLPRDIASIFDQQSTPFDPLMAFPALRDQEDVLPREETSPLQTTMSLQSTPRGDASAGHVSSASSIHSLGAISNCSPRTLRFRYEPYSSDCSKVTYSI